MTTANERPQSPQSSSRFTVRELVLIGVLTALSVVLQTVVAVGLHMVPIAAIPGLMHGVMAFVSCLVLYVMARKVPRAGTLTIGLTTYGLAVLILKGSVFHSAGLVLGGVAADVFAHLRGGYQGRWTIIVALVLFRVIATAVAQLDKVVKQMTQVHLVWYFIALAILGAAVGAVLGGVAGRRFMDRMERAGVAA